MKYQKIMLQNINDRISMDILDEEFEGDYIRNKNV